MRLSAGSDRPQVYSFAIVECQGNWGKKEEEEMRDDLTRSPDSEKEHAKWRERKSVDDWKEEEKNEVTHKETAKSVT